MQVDQISGEVEKIVRRSEVMAVVHALISGKPPRIGQVIDYVVDLEIAQSVKPFRVAVEQWHLDAAARTLDSQAYYSKMESTPKLDPAAKKSGTCWPG